MPELRVGSTSVEGTLLTRLKPNVHNSKGVIYSDEYFDLFRVSFFALPFSEFILIRANGIRGDNNAATKMG